jgi:hypothetical protein
MKDVELAAAALHFPQFAFIITIAGAEGVALPVVVGTGHRDGF